MVSDLTDGGSLSSVGSAAVGASGIRRPDPASSRPEATQLLESAGNRRRNDTINPGNLPRKRRRCRVGVILASIRGRVVRDAPSCSIASRSCMRPRSRWRSPGDSGVPRVAVAGLGRPARPGTEGTATDSMGRQDRREIGASIRHSESLDLVPNLMRVDRSRHTSIHVGSRTYRAGSHHRLARTRTAERLMLSWSPVRLTAPRPFPPPPPPPHVPRAEENGSKLTR